MAEDIDLGKISLTPRGTWNEETHVEFNDVWKYGIGKFLALKDSVGIAPSDDGVNWYELSSQGERGKQGIPGTSETVEEGFYVVDSNKKILFKIDANGVDVALLSDHLKNLIKSIPGIGGAISSGSGGVSETVESGFYIVDSEGKVAIKYDINGLDVAKLSTHFKSLLPQAGTNNYEYDYLTLDYIYMVDNRYQDNQYLPVIQSERFVNDNSSNKLYPLVDNAYVTVPALGGLSSTDAIMTSGTTKEIELSINLSLENNLKSYTIPYKIRKSYSDAKNNQIRLLCISDSFGANQGGSSDYPEYSFFSYAQKLGMTDDALRGLSNKYITLGTTGYRYNGWGSWTVANQNLTLISHSEGRGGWTASTYLRHVINTTNYKGLWYLLGLDNTYGDYDAYSGSVSKSILCHSVPSKLINTSFIKNQDAFNVAFNGSTPSVTWDGSLTAKQAAVDYYNGLINGTITAGRNPFFNINKAGDVKFDLQFYLDNYKTHKDDGVTPLIIGSTAGSQVTVINDYAKVCTPTHICLLLGTNDVSAFNDPAKLYSDLKQLAVACCSVNSIKCSIIFPISPGSYYPNRHTGVTVQSPWEPHTYYKWSNYKEIKRLFSLDTDIDKSRIYFLETFLCTDNYSSSPGSIPCYSPSGVPVQIIKKDPVHLGINAHRDIGYQIYAWTYYSSLT